MIVAMIPMGMMEMVTDQIIEVITVRHRLVATAVAMPVPVCVPAALVLRGAYVRIAGVHRDGMLIDVIVMHVVQMSIM